MTTPGAAGGAGGGEDDGAQRGGGFIGLDAFVRPPEDENETGCGVEDDGVEGMILGLGGDDTDWQLAALEGDFADVDSAKAGEPFQFLHPTVPEPDAPDVSFADEDNAVEKASEEMRLQEQHQQRLFLLQQKHLSQQQHLQGQQRQQQEQEIALHQERMAQIEAAKHLAVAANPAGSNPSELPALPDVNAQALAAAELSTQPAAAACPTTASACRYCGRPFAGSSNLRKHEQACRRSRSAPAQSPNPSSSSSVPGTPGIANDGTDSDVRMTSPNLSAGEPQAVRSVPAPPYPEVTHSAFGGSEGSLDAAFAGVTGGSGPAGVAASNFLANVVGMTRGGGSAPGSEIAGGTTSRSAGAAAAGGNAHNKRDSDLIEIMRRLETAIAGLDISARLCLRDALISLSNKAANPHLQPTPEQEALNRAAEYLVLRMLFLSGQQVPYSAPGTAPPQATPAVANFGPGQGRAPLTSAPGGIAVGNAQTAGDRQPSAGGAQEIAKIEAQKKSSVKTELECVRGMSPANTVANGSASGPTVPTEAAPLAPSGMSPAGAGQAQVAQPSVSAPPSMELDTCENPKQSQSNGP